ncbi:MAG: VOC family protein [Selenomonadaceae bacterium]|nr:VOC family protein [Selenomonadaceae bacterium]
MKIEHVAMYVNDLEAEKNFFVKYFNAKAGSKYSNFRNDFSNYFLKFDDGSRLEIMTRNSANDAEKARYRTGFHHIAICVGDRKDVDDMMKKFDADGVIVVSGARTTGDGYYEAVVVDPEGNEIEIIAENPGLRD